MLGACQAACGHASNLAYCLCRARETHEIVVRCESTPVLPFKECLLTDHELALWHCVVDKACTGLLLLCYACRIFWVAIVSRCAGMQADAYCVR